MFATTNYLGTLDLTRNNLECIPVEIAIKAKQIILSDNYINCNCTNILKEAISKRGNNNNVKFDDCKKAEQEEVDEDEEEEEMEEEDDDMIDEEGVYEKKSTV